MGIGETCENPVHPLRGIRGQVVELDLEMGDAVHQIGLEHSLEQFELSTLNIHLHKVDLVMRVLGEPGRNIYELDALLLISGAKDRASIITNGDLLSPGFSSQSIGMDADIFVVTEPLSDSLGKTRHRLKDLQSASVARVQIARPLAAVTAQVKDHRIFRQRVFEAQRSVSCIRTPLRALAIPIARSPCNAKEMKYLPDKRCHRFQSRREGWGRDSRAAALSDLPAAADYRRRFQNLSIPIFVPDVLPRAAAESPFPAEVGFASLRDAELHCGGHSGRGQDAGGKLAEN